MAVTGRKRRVTKCQEEMEPVRWDKAQAPAEEWDADREAPAEEWDADREAPAEEWDADREAPAEWADPAPVRAEIASARNVETRFPISKASPAIRRNVPAAGPP